MTLDTYLRSRADRCPACGYHPEAQGCACIGLKAKARGQAVALAANSPEAAKVEAAIRTLVARGVPFSANDARNIHGVRGGVVGATFTAMRTLGVIKFHGEETSTGKSAHGKRVALWIGAAA